MQLDCSEQGQAAALDLPLQQNRVVFMQSMGEQRLTDPTPKTAKQLPLGVSWSPELSVACADDAPTGCCLQSWHPPPDAKDAKDAATSGTALAALTLAPCLWD